MNTPRKKSVVLFLVLVVSAMLALELYEVNEPWVGLKDFNGAIYGIMSRNFLKYGYVRTRFGTAVNTGPVPDQEFTYYLHHPPLFYFLVSFSYRLFGVHEWSARIVPILFSIVSLLFFFRFTRKLWGVEAAYFSSFVLAFLPMNLYFSRVYLQESSMTLGIVLMLWYYVRWREGRRSSDYWKIVAVFVVFGLIDWPAYYVLLLLAVHALVVDRRGVPGRTRTVLLPLFGVALFLMNAAYVSALSSYQGGGGLLNAFLFRSSGMDSLLSYSLADFVRSEIERGYHLFTPIVPVLSLVWIIRFLGGRRDLERDGYVLLLLLFGAIHVILFKDAAYIHEFWLYHFCSGLALSAGLVMADVADGRVGRAIGKLRIPALACLCGFYLAMAVREVVLIHRVGESEDLTAAGMRIGSISDETDKIIVDWEDPLPPAFGEYFSYYGSPIYSKPIPNLAYYADRNIRWGLRDRRDFESLLDDPGGRYRFFVTRLAYMRDGMDEGIKSCLLEHFAPLFMVDEHGRPVSTDILAAFLEGRDIPLENGVLVFERNPREDRRPQP
jgi:hypothetical protein